MSQSVTDIMSVATSCVAGAIIAIAFIHNLLRRHPSCSILVNKPAIPPPAASASFPAPTPTAVPAHKSTDASEERALPDANGNTHDSAHASSNESDAGSSDAETADVAAHSDDRGGQTVAGAAGGGNIGAGEDVFDDREVDPAKCRAVESSLWELESLRQHYYHAVRASWLP